MYVVFTKYSKFSQSANQIFFTQQSFAVGVRTKMDLDSGKLSLFTGEHLD